MRTNTNVIESIDTGGTESKHEHLRDLYYRQFRVFTPLSDAEIDEIIVTYYNATWPDLLMRMEWVNRQKFDAAAPCELDAAVA